MNTTRLNVAMLVAVVALSANAADAAMSKMDGMLVNGAGMTVYTFDKDTAGSGASACEGPCATNWPPAPPESAGVASPYSVITRADGAKQLAYKGKPLYLYAADKQPGEHKGDNFKGMWHAVKD